MTKGQQGAANQLARAALQGRSTSQRNLLGNVRHKANSVSREIKQRARKNQWVSNAHQKGRTVVRGVRQKATKVANNRRVQQMRRGAQTTATASKKVVRAVGRGAANFAGDVGKKMVTAGAALFLD